jgi:hypothetical protein
MLGASGGGGFGRSAKFALSFAAWGEVPFGPAHVGFLAERLRQVTNTNDHGPLLSDQLWTSVSLRFGGDHHYWPHAVAGVGPVFCGRYTWLADERSWFVTAGLQLYGAD